MSRAAPILNKAAFIRKLTWSALLTVAAALPQAWGQVAQSATRPMPGFNLPTLGGDLSYAISASESASTGFYRSGNATESTNISGDLAYLSPNKNHPFSAVYSGAMLAGTEGQPFTVVQNLALSQVYNSRFWDFTVTDAAGYLPASGTTGLSGVPGLGDLGVDPVDTGPDIGQAALTGYAPRINNSTTAAIDRRLTAKTSIQGSGSFVIQRFTGHDAGLIDSNQVVGALGGSYRIDARSSASASYTLSKITYSPDTLSSALDVQGMNVGYSRDFNRAFSLDASAGPQWVKTYYGGQHTGLNVAADVSLRYRTRDSTVTVAYVRGTNNGFGVIPGGFSDSITSSYHRSFGRVWSGSATLNYTRTANPGGLGLPAFAVDTLVSGVQASRSVGRSLSTYLSYSAQHQSTGGAADTSAAFRGLYQVVAFGITYAPRARSFGAQ